MRKFCLLGMLFLLLLGNTLQAAICHSLNEVLALTLLQNPELNAFEYGIRETDARILQASLRPNPFIDVETENINASRFLQTTFLLGQIIELGRKCEARVRFAKTERDMALLDYQVKKREIFVETTLLFIDVLVNQQKVVFLEECLQMLQNFSSSMKSQVEAGKASIIEEANFNILVSMACLDLQKAKNELKTSKQALAAQWGDLSCPTFIAVGSLDWTKVSLNFECTADLLEDHPKILRSNAERNLREAKISLEKSKAYPDVAVRGGPRYLKEAEKWVWVVGILMPLSVFNRNQGAICEAVEDWKQIDLEKEALFLDLSTKLNQAYSNIEMISSELTILSDCVLPSAKNAFDASSKGYELARYNFNDLLEIERTYRNSKNRYIEALGEYHKALAVIEGLTGKGCCR